MDSIHDLGGKDGFGAIEISSGTVGFAERWHGAVFTIINTLFYSGVAKNPDHFRHAIERIDPISYLNDGYYGRWLGCAETLLVEAGKLTQAQLTARAIALGAHENARVAARPFVSSAQANHFSDPPPAERSATAQRPSDTQPLFELGQFVYTRHAPSSGHTRLPAYARGTRGEIVAYHGAWVYPDTNAHGDGEQPQHLYTVAFAAADLWGESGDENLEVCLDLFEPYLMSER